MVQLGLNAFVCRSKINGQRDKLTSNKNINLVKKCYQSEKKKKNLTSKAF